MERLIWRWVSVGSRQHFNSANYRLSYRWKTTSRSELLGQLISLVKLAGHNRRFDCAAQRHTITTLAERMIGCAGAEGCNLRPPDVRSDDEVQPLGHPIRYWSEWPRAKSTLVINHSQLVVDLPESNNLLRLKLISLDVCSGINNGITENSQIISL
jgi:hypothetical protein